MIQHCGRDSVWDFVPRHKVIEASCDAEGPFVGRWSFAIALKFEGLPSRRYRTRGVLGQMFSWNQDHEDHPSELTE
jgi:hypothetical protein